MEEITEERRAEAEERASQLREALETLPPEAIAAALLAAPGVPAHDREDAAAMVTGTSRTTMRRAQFVAQAAGADWLPDDVREEAARMHDGIQNGTVSTWAAYHRVGELLNELAMQRECRRCGEWFGITELSSRQRYCSDACRQAAYRERRLAVLQTGH